MNKLITLIKQAALEAVMQTKPAELIFAKVVQEEDIPNNIPLLIQVEQKQPMTRSFFVENKYLNILKKDNRLVLLQIQGGQKFYIVEVLEDDTD